MVELYFLLLVEVRHTQILTYTTHQNLKLVLESVSFLLCWDSYALPRPIFNIVACQLVGKLFLGSKKPSHYKLQISRFFLILMAKFCGKCQISRFNTARIPQIPRDIFGIYKGFIQYHLKIEKIFPAKNHNYQFSGSPFLA